VIPAPRREWSSPRIKDAPGTVNVPAISIIRRDVRIVMDGDGGS
jgi:hypothetical protein